jgi:cytochrome c5
MKNKPMLGLVIAIIVVAGVLAACAPAAPQATEPPKAQPTSPAGSAPAGDGAALVSSRCTVCHNLDRVKAAKKTSAQWKDTVTRMVGKGAKLSADEQAAVVDYLAKTYGP